MNVLAWYQAFMEEGLLADPPSGLGKGLTVGPVKRKEPRTLLEHSVDVLCCGIFQRVRHADHGEREDVRSWLAGLTGDIRTGLMEKMYQHKTTGHLWFKQESYKQDDFTRSEYFHILDSCWSVLYSNDWPAITVPDLHRLLQSRADIRIDSPCNVEDIERVLRRLGIVPSDSPSIQPETLLPSPTRDPSCHMTHADVYSCIFDTIILAEMSYTKKLKLDAYLNRNVYSNRSVWKLMLCLCYETL